MSEPAPEDKAEARRFAFWVLFLRAGGSVSVLELQALEREWPVISQALDAVEQDRAERLAAAVRAALVPAAPPEPPPAPNARAQALARAAILDAKGGRP